MSEPPLPANAPIEIDRPEQFPTLDENPRASMWMLATQFFIAPMAIAAAAIAVFVIASTVSTRDTRGVADIVDKIRTGGRNEAKQAAYDLAQFLNAARNHGTPISEADRIKIIDLFSYLVERELDPSQTSAEEDRTIVRFIALCQGIVGDPRSGPPLVNALASRDADLRTYAIFSLGLLQRPAQVPAIGQLLVSDDDATVRSVAAYALGSLVRSDAPTEMREDAAWGTALARAREVLTHAMQRDRDALVRDNATVALASTGDAAAVPALATLLVSGMDAAVSTAAGSEAAGAVRGPSAYVSRDQAVEQGIAAAMKLGDPALIPALEKLADGAANLALRVKAREAVAAIRGSGK